MVRAGVVGHPNEWGHCDYKEIQEPHKRYAVIDLQAVSELSGFVDVADFRKAHREWIANALARGAAVKEDRWSETIAVGGQAFVEEVKKALGTRALHR